MTLKLNLPRTFDRGAWMASLGHCPHCRLTRASCKILHCPKRKKGKR